MSAQSVATAVTAAPAAPVRTPRASRPPRPRLTVVPPLHARAPRAPFVILVAALLTAGLGGLLFLHTALAEDSFRLHDLKVRSTELSDREQALEQAVAVAASPQRLAARATALGMVRSENPAFIRTSDGRILGVPKAAELPPAAPKPVPPAAAKPVKSPAGTPGKARATVAGNKGVHAGPPGTAR